MGAEGKRHIILTWAGEPEEKMLLRDLYWMYLGISKHFYLQSSVVPVKLIMKAMEWDKNLNIKPLLKRPDSLMDVPNYVFKKNSKTRFSCINTFSALYL